MLSFRDSEQGDSPLLLLLQTCHPSGIQAEILKKKPLIAAYGFLSIERYAQMRLNILGFSAKIPLTYEIFQGNTIRHDLPSSLFPELAEGEQRGVVVKGGGTMHGIQRQMLGVGLVIWVGVMVGIGCHKLENPTEAPRPTTQDGLDTTTPGGTNTPVAGSSNALIFDPLTTGSSNYGAANGGTFSAAGFRVNSSQGEYLAYSTPITSGNIRVEFDAIGFQLGREKDILIEIFDASHNTSWAGGSSAWATNSLFQIMVAGWNGGTVRIKAGGYNNFRADYIGPYAWDSATSYHWVFSITNGSCQVTRNGQTLASGAMGGYNPRAPLNIRIGGTWDPVWTGVAGITYSNVKVYKQ